MSKPIKLALLIDDNEIDQRQYARVLRNSGKVDAVKLFTYADEALAFLKAETDIQVDVIFLDINIPRMNGFAFLEAATTELGPGFAKIVVAMLTTSLNPADQDRAKSFDAVKKFINKPLTAAHVEEVAAMVSKV